MQQPRTDTTVHFSYNAAIHGNANVWTPDMNDSVLSVFIKHIFSFACLTSLIEILSFVLRRPHLWEWYSVCARPDLSRWENQVISNSDLVCNWMEEEHRPTLCYADKVLYRIWSCIYERPLPSCLIATFVEDWKSI